MSKKPIPNIPNVVMMSLWRDDMSRKIHERVDHLRSKSYPHLRFIWVVGDSSDETEETLRRYADNDARITVLRHDTHLLGDDPNTRLERLGSTLNAGLMAIHKTDTHILHHESDLITPPDIIEQFLGTGKDVVGGWVTLNDQFYDTYLYRKDGVKFTNGAPYHACYTPDALFELDSIGSCLFYPAQSGVYCHKGALLEVCQQLKAQGYSIWCHPQIHIVQPYDLFTSRSHADA